MCVQWLFVQFYLQFRIDHQSFTIIFWLLYAYTFDVTSVQKQIAVWLLEWLSFFWPSLSSSYNSNLHTATDCYTDYMLHRNANIKYVFLSPLFEVRNPNHVIIVVGSCLMLVFIGVYCIRFEHNRCIWQILYLLLLFFCVLYSSFRFCVSRFYPFCESTTYTNSLNLLADIFRTRTTCKSEKQFSGYIQLNEIFFSF